MELPDNAHPIRNSGDRFVAFIARNGDCAMVYIFERRGVYGISFEAAVAAYETLANGATASARREIRKLERERVPA
jgi:hypothetical protein